MPSDDAWLADILSAARDALSYTAGMDRPAFVADLKTQHAVELLIVIMGEAAGKVSPETRAKLPQIPFGDIVRMRNRLVHHYFKVDVGLVWDVVADDLEPLAEAVDQDLAAGSAPSTGPSTP